MTIVILDSLPDYVLAEQDAAGRTKNRGGPPVWSGLTAPPAIGTIVTTIGGDMGPGTVRNYFTMGGWLGVHVQFENPPAWYIERNGGNIPCTHFGAELLFTSP